MAEDLSNQIRENASGPKAARGDAASMEQHSLRDQIEADRYLASKDASKAKGLGIRITKMVPSGSA